MCPSARANVCPTARSLAFLNSNSNNKDDLQKKIEKKPYCTISEQLMNRYWISYTFFAVYIR